MSADDSAAKYEGVVYLALAKYQDYLYRFSPCVDELFASCKDIVFDVKNTQIFELIMSHTFEL